MGRAFPAKLPVEASHEISSLLYAAEVTLARDHLGEAMMEKLAQDAHVSPRLARIYFPSITDLIRTCILRILALEHQVFLSQVLSRQFNDKGELASLITDFIIKSHDRTAVSSRFAEQFARHGDDFTTRTAWIIAQAALAAAIAAADGAARILARHDFPCLADPATKMRLFRTCLTALDGRPDDETFVSDQIGATFAPLFPVKSGA